MTTLLPGKKVLKFTGILTGILLLLFAGFHSWINYNAKWIVQDLVESRSKGRLKMKIEKFRFSWFSRKVELQNTVIYSTDSVNAVTAYRFHVSHIKLTVQEILPILFDKKLLIDSLNLDQPEIVVTRLKPLPVKNSKKEVSIPEELGKIYTSIQDALQALKVNRFQIEEARFTLINKVQPGQLPLTISNIHFHVDNLSVDTSTLNGKEKLLFSDNVVLSSRQQDILFPDGRHRLSFSQFRINLKEKRVEFDSCTIASEQKEGTRSRFRVFVDTLRLTRIDFDTLYRSEVIKADSVYCLNPRFDLEVENIKRKAGEKRGPPKLEEIVQQLTGELLLGFVVVNNADFHINTNIDDRRASFHFTHNTFELQGLRVARQSPRPLTVKKVALAIRNFENFIRDSTYKLNFDSILIKEDRVILDRFTLHTLSGGRIINRFSIPRFELSGLSWDDLVFNQQLKARQATLYHPVINYHADQLSERPNGKKSIFTTLGEIGQLIRLDKMQIVKGHIGIGLKNNNSVSLEDASMTLQTKTLFEARKTKAIEHAVEWLDFASGTIRAGNLVIRLDKVRYAGNPGGSLLAKKVQVTDDEHRMDIRAENAAVDDVLTDEETGDITATGIRWDKADVQLQLPGTGKPAQQRKPVIELKHLEGAGTSLSLSRDGRTLRTFIHHLSADEFLAEPGHPIRLKNPVISGENLGITDPTSRVTVEKYSVADGRSSTLNQVYYKNNKDGNTTEIRIPELKGVPDINAMLQGKYRVSDLVLERPFLSAFIRGSGKKWVLPETDINQLLIRQPDIRFSQQNEQGTLHINWYGTLEKDNGIRLHKLRILEEDKAMTLTAGKMDVNLDHFTFTTAKGKHFDAGNGEITAELKDLVFHPAGDEPSDWSAGITAFSIRHFIIDSIGKKQGMLRIEKAALKELDIRKETLTDPYKLTAANNRFVLEGFTGDYKDGVTQLRWKNAGYSQLTNLLSLDSLTNTPSVSRDSFSARLKFMKDYISTGSGPLRIGPIDKDRFIRDSVFRIGKVTIEGAWFTDYKDKRLPFAAGTIKPLPVDMLRKIPFPLSADTIQLNQARADYTEFSDKTNAAGTVPVTRMDITLLNVKNHGLRTTDSLTIRATGYVMDSLWVQLRVKESYTDSLGGFRMSLRAKPGDITVLNPALIPLTSLKLLSGKFDTLTMRVLGREYLSFGEMKMYYEDLKIRFLKSGRDEKQAFLTRLISFAANSFVIRNRNQSRTGYVFFIRQRDRSAINYLLRIALSGMSSSVGAGNNKKMIRRYRSEQEKKGLPPVEFE
ncbi:MAG: hypothetical protein HYZ15_01650 [Sphingobacteriales bacterium]|nr:hypothetical protein [Sphingobacteriales bacterium]